MEIICLMVKLNCFLNWYFKFDIYVKFKKKDILVCIRVMYVDIGEYE